WSAVPLGVATAIKSIRLSNPSSGYLILSLRTIEGAGGDTDAVVQLDYDAEEREMGMGREGDEASDFGSEHSDSRDYSRDLSTSIEGDRDGEGEWEGERSRVGDDVSVRIVLPDDPLYPSSSVFCLQYGMVVLAPGERVQVGILARAPPQPLAARICTGTLEICSYAVPQSQVVVSATRVLQRQSVPTFDGTPARPFSSAVVRALSKMGS
ncbi:hypothetical protein KIPB_014223, partial [Kipferlia bialata]